MFPYTNIFDRFHIRVKINVKTATCDQLEALSNTYKCVVIDSVIAAEFVSAAYNTDVHC